MILYLYDDVDGTGMGEGDGRKDVSDQIENEEQLLGLKEDKPPDEGQQEAKKEHKQLEEVRWPLIYQINPYLKHYFVAQTLPYRPLPFPYPTLIVKKP